MRRQGSLDEISDGRLYSRHDMVRIGCGGCRGCSACCHGMGTSAILDPFDVHRLIQGTGLSAEALFADKLELNVVDGIILPNLRMSGREKACGFLNSEGRCSIHPYRPGVCRLFPLGRYYIKKGEISCRTAQHPDDSSGTQCMRKPHTPSVANYNETGEAVSFSYFVQTQECPAPNKTKVRIEKWLDQPELTGYEAYILQWHNFLERAETLVKSTTDEEEIKNINLYILKLFFLKPYDPQQNFYAQFEERMTAAREVLDA
ncbi:MAG: YkgJ family cysteine cluster protein [Lachnospiraceae bacterium]|nr:YkgJ family cysteine cluster protein [Lachnospiraceae bacterium]